MSNALDLTSLANVKAWLKLSDTFTADDVLLTRLITAVSDFIQSALNRVFGTATYVETRNGKCTQAMMFMDYPVTAVTSVYINGTEILPAPDAFSAGFLFDDKSVYLQGSKFWKGFQNVQLVYTAGYSTIPPGIEQLAIDLIAKKYKQRDRIGLKSEVIQGQNIIFDIQDLNDEVRSVLTQYAKVVPIS